MRSSPVSKRSSVVRNAAAAARVVDGMRITRAGVARPKSPMLDGSVYHLAVDDDVVQELEVRNVECAHRLDD